MAGGYLQADPLTCWGSLWKQVGTLKNKRRMIQIEISPNRAGDKRIVIWEGINSMTVKGKFANIVWIVRHINDKKRKK